MPQNPREFKRAITGPPPSRSDRSSSTGSTGSNDVAPLGGKGQHGVPGVPGNSFAARFGRVILQHGIAAIPSALYHLQGRLGLTAQQVWFISYILAHKWDSELPYPSINKMARCAGLTRRVLQYRCNELHNCGYLEIYARRGEKNDQDTNAYDFSELFRRLEELLSEDDQLTHPANPVRGEGASPGEGNYSEHDPSFVARYGRVICKHGIAAVPSALFTYQGALGLSPQQVWFVCYIFSYQWDTALPYPSLRKMAERTGYSRQHLINIKASLVEMGYLHLVSRSNENGQDTNAYDFSGLLEAIRRQLQPEDPQQEQQVLQHPEEGEEMPDTDWEPGQKSGEQLGGRGRQQRQSRFSGTATAARRISPAVKAVKEVAPVPSVPEKHLSVSGRIRGEHQLTGGLEHRFTVGVEQELAGREEHGLARGTEPQLTAVVNPRAIPPVNKRLPRGRKATLPEVESSKEETLHEDDSNQHPQKNRMRTGESQTSIPRYSPYIAAIASDFSRELGDAVHEASNMKQALNLWQISGLAEERFAELMQEAKRITRRYQSRPTWDTMHNRMAYLFTTLRDLLGQVE